MSNRIHIKSAVLLVGILLSFSLGIYTALNNLSHEGYFSIKKIRVDIPKENRITNDILSEDPESENDNDDFPSEAFILLPFYGLSLDVSCIASPVSHLFTVQDIQESIWLSIRSFRI